VETTPTLFVKCRACSTDFPTPIGEPEAGPSGVIISGLSLRCSQCHREDTYTTRDFHVPAISDGPPEGRRDEAEENRKAENQAKKAGIEERLAGAGVVTPEGRAPRGE
jgi:hypothetical protein